MNKYSVQTTAIDSNGFRILVTLYRNFDKHEAERLAFLCNGRVIKQFKTKCR